ncbi:2OG-Fe(II) oxygenase [Sphingomonas sp. 7/4-4]|uniref:2OG-Fe(II) oxygenase n=1 Tax=Sphingomonas sp. 7/4-4 TaxID=3018446 RepID=UPI0022F37ED3|nr:2OG-Fe(II) oxygenase [Sphingomonas sp. 7/4-4]WBY08371.1 2OG-Fe(II) oxygenase [Sphingomonas sp. 7/4-4]
MRRGKPSSRRRCGTAPRDHVDARTRQAERCYWSRDSETAWIHDRLDALFAEAAARFETEVDPVFEDIQFIRYEVGAHFQTWHSDAGIDRYEERRISVSVELSDAGDYEGGVLEIAPAMGLPRTLPRGGARLFRSRMIHRVTPVTRGFVMRWWRGRGSGVEGSTEQLASLPDPSRKRKGSEIRPVSS